MERTVQTCLEPKLRRQDSLWLLGDRKLHPCLLLERIESDRFDLSTFSYALRFVLSTFAPVKSRLTLIDALAIPVVNINTLVGYVSSGNCNNFCFTENFIARL